MAELIKDAFAVLKEWPLVQGAVAILVLVIASLLAFSALKRQPPASERPAQLPAPVPVQIESPWLVQHLVEMHLSIDEGLKKLDELNAKMNTNTAAIATVLTLLRRRANQKNKKET